MMGTISDDDGNEAPGPAGSGEPGASDLAYRLEDLELERTGDGGGS